MKVYSYKMNTNEWKSCPQDFYKSKIVILKNNSNIKYEIKRSEGIYPENQCIHLVDDGFRQYYEDILHKKVRNRYVLYRGNLETPKEYRGKTILYRNIEKFLTNLNINNIFLK